MFTAIAVWVGVVLGLGLLLVMALGPVIVELDSRRYERKHERRRVRRTESVRREPLPLVERHVAA